jgi:arylesterase/paraoxonase
VEDFHPHGFSLYQDNEGDNLLFVINHRQDGRQTVEVFATQLNDQLQHLETIESRLTKWPNDLVAVGPRQFYLTDINRPYNGIGLKIDALLVYVSETLAGNINVFQRDHASGRLNLLNSHFVRVGVDNITVSQDGSLLVAVQPNLIALAKHFKNPQATSPSQVLKIRINEERQRIKNIVL